MNEVNDVRFEGDDNLSSPSAHEVVQNLDNFAPTLVQPPVSIILGINKTRLPQPPVAAMTSEPPSPKRMRSGTNGDAVTDAATEEPPAPPTEAPADAAKPRAKAATLLRTSALRARAKAFSESRGCSHFRFQPAFVEAFAAQMEASLEQCLSRALANRRRTLMASDV